LFWNFPGLAEKAIELRPWLEHCMLMLVRYKLSLGRSVKTGIPVDMSEAEDQTSRNTAPQYQTKGKKTK
jgi:hypothetical protein